MHFMCLCNACMHVCMYVFDNVCVCVCVCVLCVMCMCLCMCVCCMCYV